MNSASELYLLHRELVLSIYEHIPDLPATVNVNAASSETLCVRIDQLTELNFPCDRIVCPFLLPNKRKRSSFFNNAVTNSVLVAVGKFAVKHNICPFQEATVILVSYYPNDSMTMIDNDNKESIVILNGLNGFLLRDDRPTACNTFYYTIRNAEELRTEVYIMNSKHDIEVLSLIKAENM